MYFYPISISGLDLLDDVSDWEALTYALGVASLFKGGQAWVTHHIDSHISYSSVVWEHRVKGHHSNLNIHNNNIYQVKQFPSYHLVQESCKIQNIFIG